MLYAASADMTISEEEEALIKEKLNEKQYQSIKAIFDKSSDAAIIDIIVVSTINTLTQKSSAKGSLAKCAKSSMPIISIPLWKET